MPLNSVDHGDTVCTWLLCAFAGSITAERAGAGLMVDIKLSLGHIKAVAEPRGNELEMVETAQILSTDARARALLQD